MDYKELTVEKLIIKNKWGKGSIEIDGRHILFLDNRGIWRAVLGLDSNGSPCLKLNDALGHERVELNVNAAGGANLSFFDGINRAIIWLTTECGRSITLYDDEDKARLKLSVDDGEYADPAIEFSDKEGNTRLGLTVHDSGRVQGPVIKTYNEKGEAGFIATGTGLGSMEKGMHTFIPAPAGEEVEP